MPIPAGVGIDRRRFLAGAAGGLMTVYGAGRLGLTDRMLGDGIARAAALQTAGSPILVSLFMQGGIDGLSLLAPAGDPLYQQLRPTLAVAPGSGDTAARRPNPHLAPVREFVRRPPQQRQGRSVPEHRLRRPGHVPLHLTPLLGGGRHRRLHSYRMDGSLPGRGRRRHQPVPGTLHGRSDQPDARHRQQSDGGDRSAQQLRRLSEWRVGRRGRVGARLRVLTGRHPATLPRPGNRPGGGRGVGGGHRPPGAATVPPLEWQRRQPGYEREPRRRLMAAP